MDENPILKVGLQVIYFAYGTPKGEFRPCEPRTETASR